MTISTGPILELLVLLLAIATSMLLRRALHEAVELSADDGPTRLPRFSLRSFSGEERVRSKDLLGHPTVVMFVEGAHLESGRRAHDFVKGSLAFLGRRHAARLVVVVVPSDGFDVANADVEAFVGQVTVLRGTASVMNKFGVTATPAAYVFGASGRLEKAGTMLSPLDPISRSEADG